MIDKNKLKRLAVKNNLTMYRISKQTGITESYIQSLFNGKQDNPSIKIAHKISKLLRVKIEDLLKDDI
ncbi:MAG: helix-turn-helix transcriptional regulator [Peptostreptococcaceae bacterium]|uniref:helix-turn-helix transcriptional regulator n=1 Tax=Intestinibacter bartlettii TaxID=261299 RepID=UPI002904F1AC|nr:helix-turn-helix transcriptional regulator [Peptostreptococcaceae bacterium]